MCIYYLFIYLNSMYIGFSVISYLVERLSPEHLTTETVVAMEDHITKIQNCPNPSIIDDLLTHIVFNWRIWINASNQVQLDLVRLLLNYIKRNTEYMRKIFGVQKLFDLLSFFFWYDPKGLPSNLPGISSIFTTIVIIIIIMQIIIITIIIIINIILNH
jgi:hypothetical protein